MRAPILKRAGLSTLLIVALFSCGATLILSSCSKKPGTAIIGKWQDQATKETVEFHKDGTLTSYQVTTAGAAGGEQSTKNAVAGKYTFTDANHMNVQISPGDTNRPAVTISCEVHINGDKMSITATEPGSQQQHQTSFRRLQ